MHIIPAILAILLIRAGLLADPISREASGEYEFSGLFRSYRHINICNTTNAPMTITRVGRPD